MARSSPVRFALVAACAALGLAGCGHKTPTEPWPANTDPLVFGDQTGSQIGFQAFLGSKLDAVAVDSTVKYQGAASLRITVPGPGDPSGTYAGGAFVAAIPHSLVGYDALSFWVKASVPVMLDVAGFGNDNTGTSLYEAKRTFLPMTTSWTHVYIPIPSPALLGKERGMFFFAEGPQAGAGLTFWIDEVQFVAVGQVAPPRPVLTTQNVNSFAGTTYSLQGLTRTIFDLGGADSAIVVAHMPRYFTFTSSDPAVARAGSDAVYVQTAGVATITAQLDGIPAKGSITLNALAPPSTAAPTPTLPAADVISLFSGAYPNRPVDTWSASWDQADVADLTIAGNATKVYTNLVYSGTEFTSHPIDATTMTAYHMDLWVPSGTTFRVKLVDFGADGAYGGTGADADSQSELTFNAATTPALTTGAWVGLEIPLADFGGLTARAHLTQLILSGDTRTVFVDNVYFHK